MEILKELGGNQETNEDNNFSIQTMNGFYSSKLLRIFEEIKAPVDPQSIQMKLNNQDIEMNTNLDKVVKKIAEEIIEKINTTYSDWIKKVAELKKNGLDATPGALVGTHLPLEAFIQQVKEELFTDLNFSIRQIMLKTVIKPMLQEVLNYSSVNITNICPWNILGPDGRLYDYRAAFFIDSTSMMPMPGQGIACARKTSGFSVATLETSQNDLFSSIQEATWNIPERLLLAPISFHMNCIIELRKTIKLIRTSYHEANEYVASKVRRSAKVSALSYDSMFFSDQDIKNAERKYKSLLKIIEEQCDSIGLTVPNINSKEAIKLAGLRARDKAISNILKGNKIQQFLNRKYLENLKSSFLESKEPEKKPLDTMVVILEEVQQFHIRQVLRMAKQIYNTDQQLGLLTYKEEFHYAEVIMPHRMYQYSARYRKGNISGYFHNDKYISYTLKPQRNHIWNQAAIQNPEMRPSRLPFPDFALLLLLRCFIYDDKTQKYLGMGNTPWLLHLYQKILEIDHNISQSDFCLLHNQINVNLKSAISS